MFLSYVSKLTFTGPYGPYDTIGSFFGWDWRFQIQEYSGYLHGKHLVMFLPASGLINHSIEFDAKQSHAAKHHKIHHEHRHRFGISLRLSRFIKSRLISHFMFRAKPQIKNHNLLINSF